MSKPAATEVAIHDLMTQRWSPRAIDPDQPVPRAAVHALLESARWAPSCFNEQPWRYLVFDSSDPERLEAARAVLMDGNAWARTAPVLLLSVAAENFTKNGKPNRHGQHDVGLATENLVLQATALGLATHQMAGFDADASRAAFGIPEGFTPMAMIAVGYPAPAEVLPMALKEREMAPRERRSLHEIAFAGGWERPFRAG